MPYLNWLDYLLIAAATLCWCWALAELVRNWRDGRDPLDRTGGWW